METYKLVPQIKHLGNLHKSRTIVSIKFEGLMQRTSVHNFMGKKLNGPQEILKTNIPKNGFLWRKACWEKLFLELWLPE